MMIKQIATRAADLIERYGWIQGTTGDPDRGFCLIGALEEAAWTAEYFLALGPIVRDLQRRVGGSVSAWNDWPGRTREEVVKLLRDYAKPLPPELEALQHIVLETEPGSAREVIAPAI